jgi:hypothetical protein
MPSIALVPESLLDRKLVLGFLAIVENQQTSPNPSSPSCVRCDEQPTFTTSMLDPPTGRIFHMFECKCGSRTWVSEKIKTK